MSEDAWAPLADRFVEGGYASVKGRVRTYVLHQQLLRHLPAPPARILDVGGGAGNQSFPLARMGYDVTVLDQSEAMLDKARQRVAAEPEEVRARVRLLRGDGQQAEARTDGERFDAVLCHGVVMYLEHPDAMIDSLCRAVAPGGVLSIMTLNARTLAVRPALEHRWSDALAAFDADTETGTLGTYTRGDTVEGLSEQLRARGVEALDWYGTWLFADWQDLDGATADADLETIAEVELQASLRDPYRQLSRAFHLVGRRDG